MLYFPGQKRSRNPRESSLEVNLQATGGRSHPAPVSKHRPLALRATDQTTPISLMPSIALPVHKPIYSIETSVSQVLQLYFCSCRVSNKITLFQGSNHRLSKKCLSEAKACRKIHPYVHLLKDPFSVFLHFCYALPQQSNDSRLSSTWSGKGTWTAFKHKAAYSKGIQCTPLERAFFIHDYYFGTDSLSIRHVSLQYQFMSC